MFLPCFLRTCWVWESLTAPARGGLTSTGSGLSAGGPTATSRQSRGATLLLPMTLTSPPRLPRGSAQFSFRGCGSCFLSAPRPPSSSSSVKDRSVWSRRSSLTCEKTPPGTLSPQEEKPHRSHTPQLCFGPVSLPLFVRACVFSSPTSGLSSPAPRNSSPRSRASPPGPSLMAEEILRGRDGGSFRSAFVIPVKDCRCDLVLLLDPLYRPNSKARFSCSSSRRLWRRVWRPRSPRTCLCRLPPRQEARVAGLSRRRCCA